MEERCLSSPYCSIWDRVYRKFSTSVYENPNILNSSAGHKNNMQYKLYNEIRKKQVQPELMDSATDKLHKRLAGKNS